MVDLCTPQHVRRDLAIATVESGRHVLSEKPIATTPADARRSSRRLARADVRFGIVHNYLFFAEVRRTLELIAAGEIGPVEVAHPGLAELCRSTRERRVPAALAPRPAGRGRRRAHGHAPHRLPRRGAAGPSPSSGSPAGSMHAGSGAPVEDIALARFEVEGGRGPRERGLGAWARRLRGERAATAASRSPTGMAARAPSRPFERLEVHGRGGSRVERGLPHEPRHRGRRARLRGRRARGSRPDRARGAGAPHPRGDARGVPLGGDRRERGPAAARSTTRCPLEASPAWLDLDLPEPGAPSGGSGCSGSPDLPEAARGITWTSASTPTPSTKLSFEAALDLAAAHRRARHRDRRRRAVSGASHAHRRVSSRTTRARDRFAGGLRRARPAHRGAQLLRLAAPPGRRASA